MEILSFSGKDLATRSAAQIKYLRDHPEARTVNPNMLKGENRQHEIAMILGGIEELKSELRFNNIVISCCHDLVNLDDRTVTEIKSIDPERQVEEWYFHNSIVQCVLYDTIIHYTGGIMSTPVFRIKQGFKNITVTLNRKSYRLLFGNELYEINVNPDNYIDIIRYFEIKAEYTRKSYETAKSYDIIHSKHHFDDLRPYFEYHKLKTIKP